MSARNDSATEDAIGLGIVFVLGAFIGGWLTYDFGAYRLCEKIAGKSARYIEGTCYIASPDGALTPARKP